MSGAISTEPPQVRPPYVIELAGASNLRDVGGYRTTDGQMVRRGLVFRSAALAHLTPADLDVLARLGLRTICDFRGIEESQRAPTRLTGLQTVPVPIEPTVGAGLRDILQTKDATGDALYAVLERAYVAYALSSQAQYRAVLDRVIGGQTPLLFHCSAGKDRTGFGAALLLTALGVPWETVVADFEATNRLWRRDTVPSARPSSRHPRRIAAGGPGPACSSLHGCQAAVWVAGCLPIARRSASNRSACSGCGASCWRTHRCPTCSKPSRTALPC